LKKAYPENPWFLLDMCRIGHPYVLKQG